MSKRDYYQEQYEIGLREQGKTPEQAHEEIMRQREIVRTIYVWSHCHLNGRLYEPGAVVNVTRADFDALTDRLSHNVLDETIEEQRERYGRVRFADRPPEPNEPIEKLSDDESWRHSVTPPEFRQGWDEERIAARRGPYWRPLEHQVQRAREG